MRVRLDEDLPVRLRHHFGAGIQVDTVEFRGWKGLQSGELLRAAAASGSVDVLVTADRNLRRQQHLSELPLSVVILCPRRKRLPDLVARLPEVLRILPALSPGEAVEVRQG